MLIVVVYVDDVLVAGQEKDVDELKQIVKTMVNITDLGIVKKHCGIWYQWQQKDDGTCNVIISMNDYVNTLINDYENEYGQVKIASTPGPPNIVLCKSADIPLAKDKYRSYLGRIMYYVTKLAPECANATRELAQQMECPGTEHWKAMRRLIGYLKGKDKHSLRYTQPHMFRIVAYVDSNFATNPDNRRSVIT